MVTMVKIETTGYYNGHDNNTVYYDAKVPEGWAILPEEIGTPLTIKNFPFGLLEVDTSKTPNVITKWTPTELPPVEEPENTKTAEETIKEYINDI